MFGGKASIISATYLLKLEVLTTMFSWHGVELSGFQPGETIAIFGAGPVGLMAAYSAVLRQYVAARVPSTFFANLFPEFLRFSDQGLMGSS